MKLSAFKAALDQYPAGNPATIIKQTACLALEVCVPDSKEEESCCGGSSCCG